MAAELSREQMPLARAIMDAVAPASGRSSSGGSELEQAAEMMAQAYRLDPRPDAGHWYMVLPSWVPYARGLTWEQFCAEFDQSARRLMLPGLGCVGFEIYPAAGQIRRHRISWLDQPAPPEEDTDAVPA